MDLHAVSQSLRSVRQHRDSPFPLALVHRRPRVVGKQQAEQNGYGHADCQATGGVLEKEGWLPKNCHRDASREMNEQDV